MSTATGRVKNFCGGPDWLLRLTTVAAFMVPALALWITSGYSWGAALLLVGAVISVPYWSRYRPSRSTVLLALVFLAMGVLWLFLSDPGEPVGRYDRTTKFLLAVPCLFFAAAYPARPQAFFWGLVVGCFGAGAIAVWQVFGLHEWRAHGTTNAIQYGNLCMMLAVLLAVLTATSVWGRPGARPRRYPWIMALALLAVLAGMLGSVLSLSRGGWLALVLAMAVGQVMAGRKYWYVIPTVAALFALTLFLTVLTKPGMLSHRFEQVVTQVDDFHDKGGAETSIGQRLEHWRLAWNMGKEKPLLGWGMYGYELEKLHLVEAGYYRPSILEYKYAHNEVLDFFVKSGLVGVSILLLFYFVPMAIFWPRRTGDVRAPPQADPVLLRRLEKLRRDRLAIQLAGISVPLMYIGFGLTQVFYAHNSGIMSYLFLNILLWSCLQHVQRQIRAVSG